MISYPALVEVTLAYKPDEIKGDALVRFVILKDSEKPPD
ncbi:MAG TPA: acetate--CoA ligase [Dehalococcoidia bacterium]|nr:acetate--CoA ligase [Dehalococcoidia bacterium]